MQWRLALNTQRSATHLPRLTWARLCGAQRFAAAHKRIEFCTDENSNLNTQVMDIKPCLICICTMRTDVVQTYH